VRDHTGGDVDRLAGQDAEMPCDDETRWERILILLRLLQVNDLERSNVVPYFVGYDSRPTVRFGWDQNEGLNVRPRIPQFRLRFGCVLGDSVESVLSPAAVFSWQLAASHTPRAAASCQSE